MRLFRSQLGKRNLRPHFLSTWMHVSYSDAYRNGKGSMLPLWRFTTDDVRAVTE